jgi:serine/threonine protein kinase/Flp pilus assembly protein TadD
MIGQTVAHYNITEKLGEGGMGVVFKAIDGKLDRPVAIKFLPPHLSASEENKARFIQEARATAALNHPNILNIYDIDERDGRMFFVMEYIEGKTLKSKITELKSTEAISLPEALDLSIEIAEGLRAAHEKEIVHRDIKPENIMLTKEGHPKIMDFGIAKLKSGTGLTKTGMSLGTLSYMSPEQAQGLAADHRSDLWSLGVVLYEMLTGELPFKAEHEAALMYLIINEEPLSPSSHDRRILPSVDTLVLKMLEKDRDRRFQSMNELLVSLQAVRSDIENAGKAGKTKAIALLPFENISPDRESDYFSDGLTEELILSLSKLKNMRVVSRTSTMQYKDTKKDIKTIGRELGARYILEGSVRKFQDDLRITVQLVDVENDAQLWAAKYKGKLQDIFDIQEQVAEQIVDALMVKLSPSEKVVLTKRSTENAEALDYYMRGRKALYRRSKTDINTAVQFFQKAIELDRRYATAYAGLGEAYATLYQDFERNALYLDKAVEASHKALMYDSTLSEAFAALGIAYFNKHMHEEALEVGRKAIELDPNNYIAFWILGRIYHTSDQDAQAVEVYKKCIDLNPEFYSAHVDLYYAYEKVGEEEKRKETFEKVLRVIPEYLGNHPDDGRAHMFLGTFLAQAGRIEEAKLEAEKAINLNPADPLMLYNSACFYSRINENRLALESLRKAITSGYQNYEWIKRDSDLDNIRQEPDYIELMKDK